MPPRAPPPTTPPHREREREREGERERHTHAHESTSAVHHQPSGALASHDTACAKRSALLLKAQARVVEAPSAGHKAAPCPPSGAAGSVRSLTGGRAY